MLSGVNTLLIVYTNDTDDQPHLVQGHSHPTERMELSLLPLLYSFVFASLLGLRYHGVNSRSRLRLNVLHLCYSD